MRRCYHARTNRPEQRMALDQKMVAMKRTKEDKRADKLTSAPPVTKPEALISK